MIKLDQVLRQNPAIASQILNGEAVLVHPQKGKVKVLNTIGALIWDALDGRRKVSEIVSDICSEYDISAVQAEADTLEFLEGLFSHDLITIVSP